MTRFERWFLNRVIANEVVQGSNHAGNIENLYRMIRSACDKQFSEDNRPTINAFLEELFTKTQWKPEGFEVGKCYQHTTGQMIKIVGEVDSTMYHKCLIAEQSDSPEFKAVGRDSDAMINWKEIPEKLWQSNFS